MEDTQTSKDIRRLLKTFGVQADEAIREYFERNPGVSALHLRIVLENQPGAAQVPDQPPLHFEVEGEVGRG